MDMWTAFPNGKFFKGAHQAMDSAISGGTPIQGWADHPCFVTLKDLGGDTPFVFVHWNVAEDGSSSQLTHTINVPRMESFVGWVFLRDGSIWIRGLNKIWGMTWGDVTAEEKFDTSGLLATLHNIFVGRSFIFGILGNNTLYVWDRNFALIKTIAFTPPAGTLNYFGQQRPRLVADDNDRMVYIASDGTAVPGYLNIHSIDTVTNVYALLLQTPLADYDLPNGGFGIRGNLLSVYLFFGFP